MPPPRTLARTALLVAALASAALHAATVCAPVGTDGDGCPPGLSAEEEEAWAFAHLRPVVVTAAAVKPHQVHRGDQPGDQPQVKQVEQVEQVKQ